MVTARPVSAAEVSTATEIAHAAASYHLRQLAAAGLIQAVPGAKREHRRGRPQQRYQMSDDAFKGLDRRGLRLLDRAFLTELERRLRERRTTRTITDAEVWLGPRDHRRVRELLHEVDALVHGQARAPNRSGSRHLSVTTLLLEHKT